MVVKGLTWLGLRTNRFDEMVKFFRDVMSMKPIRDEAQIAGFQMSDGTQVELYRPEEKFHAFFTTGPVVAFRVDDVDTAEPPWKRQGSNSSALSNARARPVGITFALPTAPSSKF
jgi:catechol 2,3-dioxygenase-like lactoylglutathione lyase family enzyme